MSLIFAVGGIFKLTAENSQVLTGNLRDVAIDGGQPTAIDFTTTADDIRQTYISTPEPDRLTVDVLAVATGAGQFDYENMRGYMASGEVFGFTLQIYNDADPPVVHDVYDSTTDDGVIVDVQETSPREEASGLSLVIKLKR